MREGYCTCFVCVSVCPSVTALAASASAYTCSQRYSGVCLRLFLDKYVWIFEKTLLWREKANMQMSWNSPRAVFAHFRDQRKAGTTRRVTGQSTYRCKWPKTTEILGLHKSVYFPESDYYTHMRTNDVSIVLQFVCIEFRRGFCTSVSSFLLQYNSP